ncbi:CPBP family intramembrane glutamic endopeptidase [Rubritalea marina]|uniref:CPBP family intramembrane glutamic endopeptidase n=1 Tax=Rubritalea marina TaxID=361055 RepID=UPI000377C3BB|nr:CPBP family intramembrane glutamic endopeptidase [Rubritalea marina]
MTRLLQHDLFKLFLFIVASFVGAALLSPHLYSWGKDLAAEAAVAELSAPMEWLAKKCDNARFSRYFNRALMATALVLLFPLIKSLRRKGGEKEEKKPFLQRINPQARGWRDLALALGFSAGFLTLLVALLYQLGWIETADDFVFAKAFQKAIIPAIIVSLLEEWLFRGVLYSVLARKLNVAANITGLSLFFAAVHFLSPPDGAQVADPRHFLAGFEMLGLIGQKFLTAAEFFGVFMTLFVVGVTLAYTRYVTGSLWFAIGLHAGWVFSLKFTNRLTNPTGEGRSIWYNDSLMDGLLPLATLVVTAACIALYFRMRPPCKNQDS